MPGFGRFGQVVTRLLQGLGHRVTVVDHDPNQIELTRQFGYKAYYGDASRLDLLHSAGAANARLLVVAVDDPPTASRIVELARAHFPALQLIVRARGRTDAYVLAEQGVPHFRETFHAAVAAGECALGVLGYGRHTAHRLARRFRRYDEQQVVRHSAHRNDIKRLIAVSQQSREDLAALLQTEAPRAGGTDKQPWYRTDAPAPTSVEAR